MNEFAYLGEVYAQDRPELSLLELSLRLSQTPCGPLYKRHGTPIESWPPFSSSGTARARKRHRLKPASG
jgi:hypothetical protein